MVKCSVNNFFLIILFLYLGSESLAEESSVDQFPYLASIQAPNVRGRQHVCNGAIINNNWVLTTAGCVLFYEDPHAYQIRVGGGSDSFDGDDYLVTRREFHPQYSVNESIYNLGLLQVQTPFQFTDHVKSIDILPLTLPVRAEQSAVLAGWVYSYESQYERPAVILQSWNAVTVENSKCDLDDNDIKLCVRITTEPASSTTLCNDLSGSPLVMSNKLIAISTDRVGCKIENDSRVFTPINEEIEHWITETIK